MGHALGWSALYVAVLGGISATLFAKGMDAIGAALTALTLLIVSATLVIWSPSRRDALVDRLGQGHGYRAWYEAAMDRVLRFELGLFRLHRAGKDQRSLTGLFHATVRYELLDRALLFAVAYPLLLLFMQWVSGQDGRLGAAVVFPAEPRGWVRAVTFGLIVNLLLSPLYEEWAAASPKRFVRSVSGWLPIVAVAAAAAVAFAAAGAFAAAVAFAFAVAAAAAAAFAVAFAGAVAVAFAFAVAGAGAGAFAGAVAFAAAAAAAFAVESLYKNGFRKTAALLAVTAPAAAIATMAAALDWPGLDLSPQRLGVILFLGVLPLINALFDTISYAVTLITTQMGLNRRGHPVIWAVVDLCVALLLFLGLGAVLVMAVATLNTVTGVQFADLGGLLANLGDGKTYWWVWAMAFSTILPTAVHFVVAALSLQSLAFVAPVRRWIIGHVERAESDAVSAALAPMGLAMLWLAAVGLPAGLLSLAVWAAWSHGLDYYLWLYQQWLLHIAQWVVAF